MTAKDWWRKWNWIVREWVSAKLPERWHERTCPFCRGYHKNHAAIVAAMDEAMERHGGHA